MGNWNFADVWEAVATVQPDAPAQMQGDRTITWKEFDRRANGLAAHLLSEGLGHQSKVAVYLYNCPEYFETYFSAFKSGLVPVNTNYRYGPAEITYLFDNADAEAVVFHASFAPLLDEIRHELLKVKRWYVVPDGSPLPDWAISYDEIVSLGTEQRVTGPWGRSGDDVLMLYTGGTTGMPKGVMWRQDDLFMVLGGGGSAALGRPAAKDMEDLKSRIDGPGARVLAACPLMHGTGQWGSITVMWGAGCVVSLVGRRLDVAELWTIVKEKQINVIMIVGDAFAKPMLEELDRNPGTYDLSSLYLIASSGVMWSKEVKQGLLKHHPKMILYDSFGSTEAVGLGSSVASGDQESSDTAQFQIGERMKVLTEQGKPVEPGSEAGGMVAIGGNIPLGYYKDTEKTAKTFRTFDGVRYSIPGDYATVNADGTIHLLGRGSVVINTGGEKVFPEEVEEVLKRHEAVRDAVAVGVPDDRFGEAITAIVEAKPGSKIDGEEIIEHVKSRLARYKAPKYVLPIPSVGRSPAGKVDYNWLKTWAREQLGV